MKYYNIGETSSRIRDLREHSGYSQQQVAKLLGIDRSHLSRIESGSTGCSVDILIGVAELYHVSMDYLLLGKHTHMVDYRKALDAVIAQLEALRHQM
jgi:transcriptional regulator with XRE-family HTH domain